MDERRALLVVTGVVAAGKSTVAELPARRFARGGRERRSACAPAGSAV